MERKRAHNHANRQGLILIIYIGLEPSCDNVRGVRRTLYIYILIYEGVQMYLHICVCKLRRYFRPMLIKKKRILYQIDLK